MPKPEPVPPPRFSDITGRVRAALLLLQRTALLAREPEADLALLEAEYLRRSAAWGAAILADPFHVPRLHPPPATP